MKRVLDRSEIPADVLEKSDAWQAKRSSFDPALHSAPLMAIFTEAAAVADEQWHDRHSLQAILMRHPKEGKGLYSKANLIAGYRFLVGEGDLDPDPLLEKRIQMKPMRTQSGVAPVTVLTAPAGCPGKCIFCPDDYRMPKSYIYDEPGCQRAERDGFDPYKQTLGRIRSFESIGHDAGKVELLILGGTWSAYSKDYREWFVQRCFDAMNAAGDPGYTGSQSLAEAQRINVTALHRNVGLVIETRPDWITPQEIAHLRKLGVTKVQIGVQSLDDEILALNQRGHDVQAVRDALGLLRTAGFKLHLHWMPNLFGATPEKDRADFARFFEDPAIHPDELKIYPCSLIAGTPLYDHYLAGEYHPYSEQELVALLADVKPTIRPWTRVNRLFRDIPAHHIQAGVKASNLRQLVQDELARRGAHCGCIRCHEIKQRQVAAAGLERREARYATDLTTEYFLHFATHAEAGESGLIAGFLRLSLPHTPDAGARAHLPEIAGNAMIREVHVYGPALAIGTDSAGQPQHVGLGTYLLDRATEISRAAGFTRLSVIAATGTRAYYAARGFVEGELYMTKAIGQTQEAC
jgi:elongator complex protein 3